MDCLPSLADNAFENSFEQLTVVASDEVNMSSKTSSGIQETPVKKKRYSKSRKKQRSVQEIYTIKRNRRVKANDRERNRMHGLNEALDSLR